MFSCWFSRFFSKYFLFTLLSFKIETVDDKGLCRERRMQGLPPEVYKPLPPNSPKDTYHEEVENYSDTGSVATPLIENPKGAIVVV